MSSERNLVRYAAMGVALLLGASSGVARAETNGFKFGEGRVHPYFQFESRFDSAAVMVKPTSGGNYTVAGDMLLHFKPGVKVENPSEKLYVALNGNLDYVLYTGAIEAGTREASNLQGDADLVLGINRSGQFSVDIGDHIVRSDRVNSPVISVGVLSLYNDARVQGNYRPSGGALSIEPSYHFTSEFYSPNGDQVLVAGCQAGDATCDSDAVDDLNYLNHTFGLNARWRFLPKTALTFDSTFGIRTYLENVGTPLNTLKATVGLAGLLTTKFSTLLKVGWGHDFSKSSFSSLVAQVEGGYMLSDAGQVRVGYARNFEPMGGAQYMSYGDDRAYVDARYVFFSKLTAHGYLAADFLGYYVAEGQSNRSDLKFTADVGADYELKQWLALSGGYVWSSHSSDDAPVAAGLKDFYRNEIYVRAQVIY